MRTKGSNVDEYIFRGQSRHKVSVFISEIYIITYNLQLDGFPIELDGANFLQDSEW